MALTSTQRTYIRHYLGYPQVYLYANTRLESAIDRVALDIDASTLAAGLLEQIATVKDAFVASQSKAGLRTLDKDDVGFHPGASGNAVIEGKADVGRALVGQLSILFGVNVANDIFAGLGYQGDRWMQNNGRVKLAGIG